MKLTKTDKIWLLIRAAILPILFVLPFFTDHLQQIDCDRSMIEIQGPCYLIGTTPVMSWVGIPLLLLGLITLFSLRATKKRGKDRDRYALLQLFVTLASFIITLIAYGVLYQNSEGRMLGQIPTFTPTSQELLDKIKVEPFGVSFDPTTVIIFCAVFLLAALLQWVWITKNNRRVYGIKKGELFK